jgi:hypothetical protein
MNNAPLLSSELLLLKYSFGTRSQAASEIWSRPGPFEPKYTFLQHNYSYVNPYPYRS